MCQGLVGYAHDAPLGKDVGADALVKADGGGVPGEDVPFEAGAAFGEGDPGEVPEERASDAHPAKGGGDVEVFEADAVVAAPGAVGGEEEGEAGAGAVLLCEDAAEARSGAEAVAEEVGFGGEDGVGFALVEGEFADKGEEVRDVGGGGGTDVEHGWLGLIGGGSGLADGSFGKGFRLSGEPLVEGEREGEELVLHGLAVGVVDHFDVELGVLEDGVVEAAGVVEDVTGAGAVRWDDGGDEAEVGVVVEDFFVDGLGVRGDADDGDAGAGGGFAGEEAAVEVFVGGGALLVAFGGEELDAAVVEDEGLVAVVGDDDADGEEAVGDVGEAEEGAGVIVEAGVGGEGDVLVGVGVVDGVLGGGLDGGRGAGLVGRVRAEAKREEGGGERDGFAVRRHAPLIMIVAGLRDKRLHRGHGVWTWTWG